MEVRLSGNGSTLGELVRRARTEASLSQAQLARRLGTTQPVVSRWEHGDDEPRVSTLVRIMRACGYAASLHLERDDVDRAQIRQQLALTPDQRLDAVVNTTSMVSSAKRLR